MEINNTITNNNNVIKNVFISFVWGVTGIISSYLSLLALATVLRPVISVSNINRITSYFHSPVLTKIIIGVAFYIPDLVMAVFFTFLLALWSDVKKIFLVAFILGATCQTIFVAFTGLFSAMKIYADLPSWYLWAFYSELFFAFVLLPLSAWYGCVIGLKFRNQRIRAC